MNGNVWIVFVSFFVWLAFIDIGRIMSRPNTSWAGVACSVVWYVDLIANAAAEKRANVCPCKLNLARPSSYDKHRKINC